MSHRPILVAMDLEGVLTPEVWIAVAERTQIPDLRLTTRDLPDYDELMRRRLGLLRAHGLRLDRVQAVIAELEVLPGARAFLDRLRGRYQLVILSDTYYEFANPFMAQLGWPTLLCNSLEVDADGMIADYRLRLRDGKRHAVLGLRQLNFDVVAIGDSYNDTTMLAAADRGILFRPSANVRREFPQFGVATEYPELEALLTAFAAAR